MSIQLAIQHRAAERFEEAIRILKPLAESGDREAQFQMGFLFFTSHVMSGDEAKQWLVLAAAQDHMEAIHCLARMSRPDCAIGNPTTVPGLKLLIQAAELGSAGAQYDLATMFATGEIVTEDLQLARAWYEKSARNGNIEAQYNYALMLILGEGGPVDLENGRLNLEAAATGGDLQSARLLEAACEHGYYGFPVDTSVAEKWRAVANALQHS